MDTLEIRPGEQVALIGENASGKSRIASAFAARSGAKYIAFRDSYGSYGDRTFFMQQRWNLSSMDGEPDNPLVTLSSGELRKHQLMSALESNPKALVIDNPFIGLDPGNRRLLSHHLGDLSGKMTLLLVLSRPSEIPSFVTHVIPVRDGVAGEKMTRETYLDAVLPPAVIRMRNVSIRYGDRVILKPLTWTVREGEHWALTGANGSGKSTLLSLVCADNPQAYAHDIELFGRPRGSGESIWDIKRRIGFVSPELHRAFRVDASALDIVTSGHFDTEGLFRHPSDGQRESARRWMEEFGIGNLAERRFLRLSSGEQRLCLVARAFVKDPPLYILDEPLHGLDEGHRRHVKGLLDRYCGASGKTLVMVTHCPEEYPACIDHSLSL